MNPVFIFLVILAVIAFWFLTSWLYKPIGKFFSRIYEDAINAMKDEEKGEEQNER